MLPTSPGKAPTRWTPSPEMDGPNSTMMVRSTAKSASISPTNQPSKLANGDFFSSLLDDQMIKGMKRARRLAKKSVEPHALRGCVALGEPPALHQQQCRQNIVASISSLLLL